MGESPDLLQVWSWPLMAASASVLLTEVAIRYARRRALLDHPERRRAHRVATPRGGGIGIVAAAMMALGLMGLARPGASWEIGAAAFGLFLVAAIGWWDDHRALRALPKLAVHIVSAIVLVAALGTHALRDMGGMPGGILFFFALAIGAILIGLTIWSINLHNFMDGINGLLAWQSVFVFGALALLGAAERVDASFLFSLAAAALAFVPFNFPKARVFMGDVGSGALGFLMIAAVLMTNPGALLIWAILDSAFVTDATATLLVRVLGRRRWYSAHREHLYQWLVRRGLSHPRVVGLYALWNLCIALPCAFAFTRATASWGPGAAMDLRPLWLIPLIYLLASVVWIGAKRWCLRQARRQGGQHGSA